MEDDPRDAELTVRLLADGDLDCDVQCVATRAEFKAALADGGFDLILSDYTLPGFDGMSALTLAHQLRPGIPFLFLSGTIGEERAVECLKQGATDFLIKDRFARLVPAVKRAVEESRQRAQHREADEALRRSEERYALAASGANDGLWDWDVTAGKVFFSPRWKAMLGFEDSEIGDGVDEWLDRVNREDLPGLNARLVAELRGQSDHFECEYRIRHRDGKERWMLSRALALRDDAQNPLRMVGSQTDITQRKLAEQQLLHDALHDALTGLPNRASLLDRLGLMLSMIGRRPTFRFATLFLDLDHFKLVNDGLGHVVGDGLLVQVAERLSRSLREADTVARLGGDEFAVLLDDVRDVSEAIRLAERVHAEFSRPFHVEGHEIFTSCSIGIALSLTGYTRPEDVLRDADTAMYRAKSGGRGRNEVFDQTMHARALAQLQLESDLRRALVHGEFLLEYQPVVSVRDGSIQSVEALARWRHPERGRIMPVEFIPTAEETGLIVPLGAWSLQEALRQMRCWREAGLAPSRVNVNLSPRHLARGEVVRDVRQALQAASLPAECLGLEITETALMEAGEAGRARLLELRGMGVRLLLDDFGTGYSSLSYLHRFPIDALKIDASFVSELERTAEKAEIVRSILAIGRNLRKAVVAEGVETQYQLEHLKTLECDYGQGYIWSEPVPGSEIPRLLRG